MLCFEHGGILTIFPSTNVLVVVATSIQWTEKRRSVIDGRAARR